MARCKVDAFYAPIKSLSYGTRSIDIVFENDSVLEISVYGLAYIDNIGRVKFIVKMGSGRALTPRVSAFKKGEYTTMYRIVCDYNESDYGLIELKVPNELTKKLENALKDVFGVNVEHLNWEYTHPFY